MTFIFLLFFQSSIYKVITTNHPFGLQLTPKYLILICEQILYRLESFVNSSVIFTEN